MRRLRDRAKSREQRRRREESAAELEKLAGDLRDGRVSETDAHARARGLTLTIETVDDDPDDNPFALLTELQERPELLKPPEPVVPILAYRGRTVILAATDKSGKSTLASDAIACVSTGDPFLGLATPHGRALLVGLEEHVGDAVLRFQRLSPDPNRVELLTFPPDDLYGRLEGRLEASGFDLMVVDSLQEYARVVHGQAPDDGDNAGWAAIVRPLVALSRRHDVAVLVLHHARRSDGKARGATEIFAAVDATLEMERVPGDSRARKITGRGRWTVDDVVVRLGSSGRYELAHGPDDGPMTGPEIDDMVLDYVRHHGGASTTAVREGVPRKATEVSRALDRLQAKGVIRDRGDSTGREWYSTDADLDLAS